MLSAFLKKLFKTKQLFNEMVEKLFCNYLNLV